MSNLRFLILRPKWITVIVGVLVFWLTQTEWLTESSLWQKAEGALIDRRYLNRPPNVANPNIKLVGIENSSIGLSELSPEEITASPALQYMQNPWPWDRRVYAAILDKLTDAGAKVVMFDLVFAAKNDGDEVFGESLQKHKEHVVIGAQFAPEEYNGEIHVQYTGPNDELMLPETTNITGMVNLWADSDEIQRRGRYRTSLERESSQQPGFDPKMRAKLKKLVDQGKIPDSLIHISALTVEKFKGHVETPPYDHANFINYRGPKGTYDALPVEALFVPRLWTNPPYANGSIFSNKVVVVGPMADIFHDIHTTPFGDIPGPEIQAEMISTLLQDGSLTEPTAKAELGLALGATILALIGCLGIPQAMLKALLLILTTIIYFVVCQFAFADYSVVLPMMPPLFCLVATGSFGIIFEYTLEQLERRRYRNILGRYVSENVAKALVADTRSLQESLKGQKKRVTILFSDIRSFTTMTENTDPDKLVAQLNEYFEEMIEVIQEKNQGTLQKFIGDAIMAAWGDTHTDGADVDARRSLTAALQMRESLKKLNAMWKDNPDRKVWATGIGVNHGEVIYGNIGSQERAELTVIGDGVNMAARMESATKQFHTDVLVGEEAERLTRQHFIFRSVGAIAFKGKTKPVETFFLISDKSLPPPKWLEPYEQAVKLYRAKKFVESIALLEKVQQEIGKEDYLCDMYISHCVALKDKPVLEKWDGAFTLSEK